MAQLGERFERRRWRMKREKASGSGQNLASKREQQILGTATGRARHPHTKFHIEVWLSLVERYVRDVEVASSNLVTSIKKEAEGLVPFASFFVEVN